MEVKLGTFSQVQESLERFENQPATPPAIPDTPAPDPVTPPVIPDTPAPSNEGQPAVELTDEQISQSTFDIPELEEEPVTPPASQSAATPASFNWKDEIKKIDRKELLKEAGLTDFAIELNEHLAKGGKAEDYLSARAIDYNSISDEALLKSQIKKQYTTPTSTPSPQQIDLLYNRKYGIPEDASDDDKMFADLQAKSDANNIRQQAIAEQQKYKLPEGVIPQTDEAYSRWKEQQESQSQVVEQLNNYYSTHEATKALHESKKVTINVGKDVPPFNFNIDKPEFITNAFTDGGKTWQKLTHTQSGEPDVATQQKIALFSINPQKFVETIFNYGMQWGVRNKIVAEGQNAQRPQAKVINADPNAKPAYKTGTYGGGQ